jgi:glyoxalase-like protein
VLLGIDHVVLAVDDPDATAEQLEAELGLRASGGGRHEALGTFNRLIWLGDTYLELVGVFDRDLAAESWLGRPVLSSLERGGGLVTWAIAVEDLDGHLRWAPGEGRFIGPIDGERRRPDRRVVRWRLAHPPDLGPALPFVIEHDLTGAEWTPDERAARAAEEHPVGSRVRLAGLEVLVDSPPVAAGRIRSLLATSVEPDGRRAVRVVVGPQAVRFAMPGDDSGPPATVDLLAESPGKRRTSRVGDCEIRLRRPRPDRGAVRGD